MELQTIEIPGSKTLLKTGSGSKNIRDYSFSYSFLGLSIPDKFTTIFPRIGYLTFTMTTGKDLETRFMNYEGSVTRPNHLYISGMFTESSLHISQTGCGMGYAMKVHPVIGYHFLKVPMQQLLNRQIRICDIIGTRGRFLEKIESDYRINDFDDPFIIQFFEQILPPKNLYQKDPIFHAVNRIIKERGMISIDALAKQHCMSPRNLNRQFILKVGLSAQAYAKIWKLKNAMELIQQNPGVSLSEIAFRAGYYDVAHLARDFKNRVDFAPTQLHRSINPLSQQYFSAPASLK